jgi:CheY-like chemotaxis protein
LYYGGIITKEGFILRVLEGAARHHPAKMAARLPRYLLDVIRKATESSAPNVPYLLRDSLLSAEEVEAKSESTFNGFCRWHHFFTAGVSGSSPRGFDTDLGSNTAPENDVDGPYLPWGVPVAPYNPPNMEPAMSVPLRPHRILVVHRDKPNAEELATRLRQAGHTVEIAYDQQSALELQRTFGPQMVIITIGLSGPDPNDIARALRAQASRDFILVSTGEETRDRIALRTCFDDHLNEHKNGSLFLMRRHKDVVSHYETVEELVEHRLTLANRMGYCADEQFVICMLAVAVFPSSPAALAPLIPDEFLRKIRAFAESPTDLANYLVVYKQKVCAEAEYWEDVVEGASLWSRYFNP